MDAACHWVGGGIKDETPDDAAVLGVTIVDDASADEDFEVWPENWEVVQMFLRCQTQWRTTGMGGVIGFDYGAVAWLFRLHGVKDQRALLEDLQIMEAAVLAAFAKQGS